MRRYFVISISCILFVIVVVYLRADRGDGGIHDSLDTFAGQVPGLQDGDNHRAVLQDGESVLSSVLASYAVREQHLLAIEHREVISAESRLVVVGYGEVIAVREGIITLQHATISADVGIVGRNVFSQYLIFAAFYVDGIIPSSRTMTSQDVSTDVINTLNMGRIAETYIIDTFDMVPLAKGYV